MPVVAAGCDVDREVLLPAAMSVTVTYGLNAVGRHRESGTS
jgi:hypothetical protein